MSALAIAVLALACGDLARSGGPPHARWYAVVTAVVAAAGGVVLLGASSATELLLVALGLAAVLAWVLTTSRPLSARSEHAVPLAVLGVALLVQVAALAWVTPAQEGGPLGAWLERVPVVGGTVPPATALLVVAAMLAQLSTANIVVRLVLASVGALKPAGQPQASDRLRGGRLLGPMERLLILGLGLAGQPTAAGLVIAAKGLIRFPELQAQARLGRVGRPGIDELTEYFLIGSFVSWLFALATLGFITVFR
jgi:uncharacterized membrane protein HdeD (DUF308 family)